MIHAELSDDHDIHVGGKRVARLMRAAYIRGVSARRAAVLDVYSRKIVGWAMANHRLQQPH